MKKMKLSAVVLSLFFTGSVMAAGQQFAVTSFQLTGDIQGLTDSEQSALADVLAPFQGKKQNLARLQKAQQMLQNKLNSFGKGQYQVVLPAQRVENGNVLMQLVAQSQAQTAADSVIYQGSTGYDAKNVENSLPSLKVGKKLDDGRQWFDPRELNMAQENPLKLTRLHYDLHPQTKSADLTVSSFSPLGHYRTFVAVDNYGSREFKRGRLTIGHVNANLTGNDDVLSVNALTNFYKPAKSFAVGVGYSRPFYENHQMLSGQLAYSHVDSVEEDGLPSEFSRKLAKGKTTYAALNWSYYLPQFGLAEQDQFKLNVGYNFRHYDQRNSLITSYMGTDVLGLNNKFSVAGINVGVSGEIKLTPNAKIEMEVVDAYYSHKLPGSSHMDRLGDGFNRDYNILNYRLAYNHEFTSGWKLNTQLSGQYTRQDLNSIDQFSVTGVYNVRGFKYNSLSAERGLVWRNEVSMPKYTSFYVSPYAFYDLGQFRYNEVNAQALGGETQTISTAGLGVRAELVKNLNLDTFVARRLANHGLDTLRGNAQERSDRTTFWGRVSYSF